MTSVAISCFLLLVAITLICTVVCNCTCSIQTTDFEYTRRYRHRFRSNLLHPHVCVASVDPILHDSEQHMMSSRDEPCCCRGLWRRTRLMLDGSELYMPTAYYCHRIDCPTHEQF